MRRGIDAGAEGKRGASGAGRRVHAEQGKRDPPRVPCQGIVGGLVGAGAEVLFVAPRLSGEEDGTLTSWDIVQGATNSFRISTAPLTTLAIGEQHRDTVRHRWVRAQRRL